MQLVLSGFHKDGGKVRGQGRAIFKNMCEFSHQCYEDASLGGTGVGRRRSTLTVHCTEWDGSHDGEGIRLNFV